MSFDPGRNQVALEEGARELESAAEALFRATKQYELAQFDYDKAMEVEKLKIFHDYAPKRPPAKDIRDALAHEKIDPEVYARYLSAKAHRDACERKYQALKAAVSARQSLNRIG